MIYHGAIAESLFQFGKSDEMAEVSKDAYWRMVYLDGKTMRSLFERCIEVEERDLEAAGLQKISASSPTPLSENQRCFRTGYPAFHVEPFNRS